MAPSSVQTVGQVDHAMTKTPDREEAVLRMGCGAIAGFLVAVNGVWMLRHDLGLSERLLLGAAGAVLCAFLAYRYGERFWVGLRDWLHWTPWG